MRVPRFILALVLVLTSVNAGFFDNDDIVTEFTSGKDLKDAVAAHDSRWVILFYAHWCGHCKRFSPVFSNIAAALESWTFVKFGVIDCGDAMNGLGAVCTEYGIWPVPNILYFDNGRQTTYYGNTEVETDVEEATAVGLADLEKFLINKIPCVAPVVSQTDFPSDSALALAFVKSEEEDHFVSELCLQAKGEGRDIRFGVATIGKSSSLDSAFHVDERSESPVLLVLPDGEDSGTLSNWVVYPQHSADIGDFMGFLEMYAGVEAANDDVRIPDDHSEDDKDESSDEVVIAEAVDYVSPIDITKALYYALNQEVPAAFSSVQSRADAVKKLSSINLFLKQLRLWFPGGHNRAVLARLQKWVDKAVDSGLEPTSEEWLRHVDGMDLVTGLDGSFDPIQSDWMTCRGSQPNFRGYPCGLWLLFHTLTTRASVHGSAKPALLAVREYVVNFFGCGECADNFYKMSKNIEWDINSDQQAALFLWKAHNQANLRLHGDPTEDPAHPKVQFPNDSQCVDCRDGEASDGVITWDDWNVVRFLEKRYRLEDMEDAVNKQLLESDGHHHHGQELSLLRQTQKLKTSPVPSALFSPWVVGSFVVCAVTISATAFVIARRKISNRS